MKYENVSANELCKSSEYLTDKKRKHRKQRLRTGRYMEKNKRKFTRGVQETEHRYKIPDHNKGNKKSNK